MKKSILFFGLGAMILIQSCGEKPAIDSATLLNESQIEDVFKAMDGVVVGVDSIPIYKSIAELQGKSGIPVERLVTDLDSYCNVPEKASDLNSGTDIKIYKFDYNASKNAAAMGFTGKIKKGEILLVEDCFRYSTVLCNGKTKKLGVGLRCFIVVSGLKGELAIASLAGIASSVELYRAKAKFEVKSLGTGIDGELLAQNLKSPTGEYNVDNFTQLALTFNNMLTMLENKNFETKIRPVLLL